MSVKNTGHYFLSGGGEMGTLIRATDWSKTSLGNPEDWPQSLRTMVAVMLDNPFGMYIAWGNEYVQLYNDGYRPILGATKHPQALGRSTRETFSEIWHIIGSMFDGVMRGKAVGFPDFMLPLNRNGFVEECYFDFSYSPIRKEDGEVGGVLVTVIETTNQKKAQEGVKESEERFRTMADNIPNLAWMANADGWIYWYNKRWYEYTGTTPDQMEGWGWQSVHDPKELPFVLDKWQASIASGQPFEMVFPLKGADGKFRQFLTRVLPVRNMEGKIYQWFGSNTDITVQKEAEEVLKESQQRFHNTVKQAPVGITILRGKEFMVEMANDAYLQLVDKKETEFVGKPLFDSLPEVEESVHALLDNVLDTGIAYHGIEYPIPVNRYGKFEVSYFDFLYHPLKEEDGKISGIIVTVTDVSSQVLARVKVEQSELKFRLLADSMPQHIWTSDIEGNLNYFNKSVFDYSGLSLEQINKDGWLQIVHPDDREGNIKEWINSIATGKDFLFEHRFRRYDGEYRWQLSRAIPQKDEHGKIQMWVGTSTDIQEQKIFANELEKQVKDRTNELALANQLLSDKNESLTISETFNRSLTELSPNVVYIYDLKTNKPVFLNATGLKIIGYDLKEINALNNSLPNLIIHPDDKSGISAIMEQVKVSEPDKIFEHEYRIKSPQGTWIPFLARDTAFKRNDKNEATHLLGIAVDITELKKAQSILLEKNSELEKMNKELQSFAYISSHDLQEPLRKIQTFSTRILEKEYPNLSENGKDHFQRMQNAANRMQTLIEDLLAYSRTNTAEREFENTDLNKIVEEVKEDLKEELHQKNASIEATEMCDANIIPFQFRQLFYNLISNSLKFSNVKNPPYIKIKSEIEEGIKLNHANLAKDARYCHISISDNGIGFEPQYSEKIFEVFQRLHGKSEYTGTGIGLAIVKKIVENHHGFITAQGEPNKGATFDIYIPAS